MRHHAQPNSSTSENLPSSFFDIPISLKPPSGIGTSFTVHSYPRSTHLVGDQESLSSLSATNTIDLPNHTHRKISRPPTPDLYHYPLRLDNQKSNHPGQDLRHHIFPVKRIDNSLNFSANTRREVTRLTQTSTEIKFEINVKFFGLYPHPIPTSTHYKHRPFPSLFVVTSLQFTSSDEPPFDC